MKRFARKLLEGTGFWSRRIARKEFGASGPHGRPNATWPCAVLKSQDEVQKSVEQVQRLGLPLVDVPAKNWDSLAALELILRNTNRHARIFDAGGELYSMILPWLALYGYRNLTAGNLVFDKTTTRGPITYEPADITKTKYADGRFDAVTCLSVIEHGVDLNAYFREMARITKRGGLLITSTDYFETSIDTRGQSAYGVPIHIFTKAEITDALELAGKYGFSLVSPIDLSAGEKVVHWERFDLWYTFAIFALRKVP